MLNLVGAIAGMTAIGVNLVAITTGLSLSLNKRLGLAAVLAAWVGLASGLGAAGDFAFAPDQPIPLVGVFFAAPLLVMAFLALKSQKVRSALMAMPMHLLIGLNAMRVLGVLFLLLAANGATQRSLSVIGWIRRHHHRRDGAVPLALATARSQTPPIAPIRFWNLFGVLDLFAAVSLGIMSTAGSPLALIHAGVGSEAMQLLPFCLVPTVLVPFYLITHAIIAAQLTTYPASLAVAKA
jgi:hypothetical protein